MESYIKGKKYKEVYRGMGSYYVGLLRVKEASPDLSSLVGHIVTFRGDLPDLNDIDTYIFTGSYISHPKYGDQFDVRSFNVVAPDTTDAIFSLLTSGMFKGIGKKKARKIVDKFKKDTLNIILDDPDKLLSIEGITEKNVDKLHNELLEHRGNYKTIIRLTDMGFSMADATNIYDFYKTRTDRVVDENIYNIYYDIIGFTYRKVDAVALRANYPMDDIRRVQAAIYNILDNICNIHGNSFSYDRVIYGNLYNTLGINITPDTYLEARNTIPNKIIVKEEKVYLKAIYEAECLIVKRFRMLNNNPGRKATKRLSNAIKEEERLAGIIYNEDQKDAIKKSYTKDFLIITGGPGTGKTTIMKGIVDIYQSMNKYSIDQLKDKIALLAPTGRAAKRISEATHQPASTIHRFLKWNKDDDTYQVNENNKSKVEFVIVDESSMIDTYLMANLLRGISSNCRIVLIGDDHQLPSVGTGQVLHDLIDSKSLETVFLTELYRQGKDSNIITLAYDIRKKSLNKDLFNKEDDLSFIECPDTEVISNIKKICKDYSKEKYKNFQILAPIYRGINGIDSINKEVQDIFNPSGFKMEKLINGVVFREGDKVIQLTNMPDDNVFNGDVGVVEDISLTPNKVKINFDGNTVEYTPNNYNNFRHAYCISIHKSQGSEFDIVVIPIVKSYGGMLYQKLIYTASTRAKKKLIFVGDYEALTMAINNSGEVDNRRTTIKDFLINGIK